MSKLETTPSDIRARLFQNIEAAIQAGEPHQTFWLSFAGDEGFRGVVLVDECQSFEEAYLAASVANANPHGEVQGIGFTVDNIPADQRRAFMALPRLTVLSKEQLLAAGINIRDVTFLTTEDVYV